MSEEQLYKEACYLNKLFDNIAQSPHCRNKTPAEIFEYVKTSWTQVWERQP